MVTVKTNGYPHLIMVKPDWAGVYPALCTVTDAKGDLDVAGMRAQVEANIEWGAEGVCPGIIAGEFFKFGEEERMDILDATVEAADGRVPVLFGVSHSGTELAIRLAKHAEDRGADGVIAMVPYFSHTPSRAIVLKHIGAICDATSLPVMLQDAEDADLRRAAGAAAAEDEGDAGPLELPVGDCSVVDFPGFVKMGPDRDQIPSRGARSQTEQEEQEHQGQENELSVPHRSRSVEKV